MLNKTDLKQIGDLLDERLKRELKPIKDHLSKIDDTLEIMLRLIRHDYQKIESLESRISRIESHLKLQPSSSSN